ncbi:hypothetical protein C8R41DRAFT_828402 [Lentinula lateritia]|uniref:Uncharacterized protein n=1 Tax=Lentinula lateritia TaxID=40482 RepID=A0ABQ8VJE4_9AGAR|nr:hypothetical protein C8R41DRAFT_828402 [Lentinula lateritia]
MAKLVKKSNTDSGMPAKLSIKGNSPATSMYLSTRNVATPRPTTVSSSKEPGKRISNTMQIALASATSSSVSYLSSTPALNPAPSLDLNKSTKTKSMNLYPQSKSVHYWAARALTAETLLAAGMEHSENLRSVTVSQETKRATEVAQLTKLYDKRLAKLEKLLVTLLGVLFTITFLTFFSQLTLIHGGRKDTSTRSQWAHFTIPILSPFASVVEHEVSVVGSKTIVGLGLVISGLAYLLLRHDGRNRP